MFLEAKKHSYIEFVAAWKSRFTWENSATPALRMGNVNSILWRLQVVNERIIKESIRPFADIRSPKLRIKQTPVINKT